MVQTLPRRQPPQLDWPSPLMTTSEVAAVMRLTPKTVREHIRRGQLRALRIERGGPYRVHAQDAQRWAEEQLVEPDLGALAVDRYVARRSARVETQATMNRRRRPTRVSP